MKSTTRPFKDVRFSSVPTDIASPKGTSFEEHLLALINLQRKTIEMERDVIVDERRAWDEERACLMSRISELEAMLDTTTTGTTDTTTDPTAGTNTTTTTTTVPGTTTTTNRTNRSHKRDTTCVITPLTPKKKPDHKAALRLKLSELGPPDRNRTMDAGHTPMAVVDDSWAQEEEGDDNANEGQGQTQQAHPRETSDSYFPDLPEDPALKGPLSLLNDKDHDTGFLKELNEKLLDEARQGEEGDQNQNQSQIAPSGDPKNRATTKGQGEGHIERHVKGEGHEDLAGQDGGQDDGLELRLKSTTNFGSAFGDSHCGKC